MAITETDRKVIFIGVVVFNIVGLFGNINVIYAHYRLKALRTKYGTLLSFLVISHTICLLYELAALIYDVSGLPLIRRACFYVLSPYIFTFCVQMDLMAAISTDMLLSIAAPFRHRALPTKAYLATLIAPGFIYGFTVITLGVFYVDDEEIKLCQPPSSLPFAGRKVWYLIGLVFSGTTGLAYTASFVIICIRLIFIFLINILDLAGYSKDVLERAQAN